MTERNVPEATDPSYTRMTAEIYDALYSWKDYEGEAAKIKELIAQYKQSPGNELLDVATGTGLHLPYLVTDFRITGVDLSEQQLSAARKRLPEIEFMQADMRNFNLGRPFDVVTCLFSSIGYVYPYEDMEKTVGNMANHLKPGGILLIEPWLQPGVFNPDRPPHSEVGELPEKGLKVTRTAYADIDGSVSVMRMHHIVEGPQGRNEFTEEHRLAMYTPEEFNQAFSKAGLTLDFKEKGLSERGLLIGTKPLS